MASASTFRGSDKRGGANGARIRPEPQCGWEVNEPDELAQVPVLEGVQRVFNSAPRGCRWPTRSSPAQSPPPSRRPPRKPGLQVEVPFAAGRVDATEEHTDAESFEALEPTGATGSATTTARGNRLPAEFLLLDRANLLTPSAPEMTVLVGGLRVLGANHQQSQLGAFTRTPGSLTNDLFVNLLDLGTTWKSTSEDQTTFEAATPPPVRSSGPAAAPTWSSASNSELRVPRRGLRERRREGEVRARLPSPPGSRS